MGLFSRKDSAAKASPSRPRPSVSSEAQAAELRGRARRRLAGAVALILAAVVTLPMLLDSEPVPVASDIAIRIPERNAPFQPQLSPQVVADASAVAGTGTAASGTTPETVAPTTETPVEVPQTSTPVTPPVTPPPVAAVKPPPATQPPAKQPTPPKPTQRDEDGARALALLEGRAPTDTPARPTPQTAAQPAAKGNFVLQIAAYGTQSDAQSRRTKLHQAGVTNAFVEQTSSSGKTQYRLRVGPFPSREAAQAAQARLRTLGYDNGFIASQ